VTDSHTFLFADLAGFTALTEAMGDEDAAEIAADFSGAVRPLLAERGADEVKTIGDALMLRIAEPAHAVALGVRIVEEVGGRHGFPVVRVGMDTGPAVQRGDDWFGATVNLAARVAGLARGGEVLLTDATRLGARELAGIELHERGRQELRNVAEPVLVFAAFAAGSEKEGDLPIDPVCRMAVDPQRSAGTLVHDGREYHFCSMECVARFAAAPERFASHGTP
jgi:adenylate cyclase